MNVSRRLALLGSTCLAGLRGSSQALAAPTCQSLGQESPPGAVITGAPSTYVINASATPGTAGQGNIITITSGSQVAYNGTTAAGTSAVTSLAYIDHTAFWGNTSGGYFGPIISATNTGGAGTPTATPGVGSFTDPGGNVWTVTAGGVAQENGVTPASNFNVAHLYLISGVVWQVNTTPTAYYFTQTGTNVGTFTQGTLPAINTGGTAVTSPLPVILLSNTTVGANAPSGSTVGTLSVTTGLPNGTIGTGAYAWVFSVSGTTAVTVSGSSLLTNGVLPGGTFSFQVSAANAAVIGSPFGQSFSITVASPGGESAPGTAVTSTAGELIASSTPGSAGTQNVITITSGEAIAVNGTNIGGGGANVITPGVGSFTDGSGNVYTIVVNGTAGADQAYENGTGIPGGEGTSKGTYYNNLPYFQDGSTGNWYTWNGTTFTGAAAPPLTGGMVSELFYIDHTAFQNSTGGWFGPITATSPGATQLSGTPAPTIVLSNSTVAPSSPAGTVVGAITVTTGLPNATVGTGAYTWALSLSGTNANDFQIVSGNLETAVANLAASTYSVTITATNSAVVGSPFTLPTTITVGAGTGNFVVSNGKVLTPSGATFIGRGVAMHDYDLPNYVTNAQCQPLTTLFPGVNMLRVAVGDGSAPAYWAASLYATEINWLSAAKIVVVLQNITNTTGSNSGGNDGYIFTTANGYLTPESNWYAAVAAYYTSPYVWFGTNNEPSAEDSNGTFNDVLGLRNWQLATYNAIRNAGNKNIIEIEMPSTYLEGSYGTQYLPNGTAADAVYSGMTGIVFGPHFYGYLWDNNGTTASSQATIYSSAIVGNPGGDGNWGGIVQQVANIQTLQSADGVVPCGCYEFGTAGANGASASATNLINAVFEAVTSGPLFCFMAWAIGTSGSDNLTNGEPPTTLTSYGTAVAGQTPLNS